MVLFFTPLTFLFLVAYFSFLSGLLFFSSLIMFWVIMEFSMFVFMGVSYSVFVNSISSLMVYYVVQTIASVLIIISAVLNFSNLFLIFFFLKLAMFPFYFWLVNSLMDFPPLPFFMAITFQKFPIFIMMLNFNLLNFLSFFMWMSIVLSIMVAGIYMILVSSLRVLLLTSSIATNSWLSLSVMVGVLEFFLYFFIYSFFIITLIYNKDLKPSILFKTDKLFVSLFSLTSVSGVPPLPLFFPKIMVMLGVLNYGFTYFMVIVLVFSVIVLLGYFKYTLSLIFSSLRFAGLRFAL